MAAVTSLVCDGRFSEQTAPPKTLNFKQVAVLTYHLDALHERQPDGLVS